MKSKTLWITALVLCALDRAVKLLTDGVAMTLIPGVLGIRSVYNTGMALGLMQGRSALALVLSLALLAVCAGLLRAYRLKGLAPLAIGLILGGAAGNLIDRAVYGYVFDMIETLFMDFYIFNLADAGVVVGAILCGISLLLRPEDWSKPCATKEK